MLLLLSKLLNLYYIYNATKSVLYIQCNENGFNKSDILQNDLYISMRLTVINMQSINST